jgi:hypothetical protein
MAALLAGLALITTRNKDGVRNGVAFNGRVSLPFLECPPPPENVSRLALVPQTGDWVVYKQKQSGEPTVKFRGQGLEGFEDAVLTMTSTLTK